MSAPVKRDTRSGASPLAWPVKDSEISAQAKPVVREGKVVVRSIMKMTLSSDHRIIDGAMAARFINAIKQKLENLELWKLLTA